jgi:hypothetical protein
MVASAFAAANDEPFFGEMRECGLRSAMDGPCGCGSAV